MLPDLAIEKLCRSNLLHKDRRFLRTHNTLFTLIHAQELLIFRGVMLTTQIALLDIIRDFSPSAIHDQS